MEKKAQVWVETVIYTLIGLALIGLVLGIATPKINEYRDRSVVEQSIESLNLFDSKIKEVLNAPGNKRIIEFRMKRGNLYFKPADELVLFELEDSRSLFSEPGIPVQIGRINVTTIEGAKRHKILMEINYNSYNMTFDGSDAEVKFTQTSVPYEFSIENKGFVGEKINIDVRENS